MNVIYHVLVDDPGTGRMRTFAREADEWPFPGLPAPGDAITIDVASPGALLLSVAPRKVNQVIYSPAKGVAQIVCSVTGPADPELQIEKLLATGFVEVARAG